MTSHPRSGRCGARPCGARGGGRPSREVGPRVLPAVAAAYADSASFASLHSRCGTATSTVTSRSPRVPSLRRTPRPRTRMTRPLWVPSARRSLTGPPLGDRDGDVGAERGLVERDRHGDGEVVAVAAEDRVRRDLHRHEQVAGLAAVLARRALAAQPDLRAVAHARGDAGLHGAGRRRVAAAAAGRARVVDDEAATAAGAAGLGEREAARVAVDLPGPAAGGAHPRRGAVAAHRCPEQTPHGASRREPQREGDALERLVERQRHRALDVGAAARRGSRPPPRLKIPPNTSPRPPPPAPPARRHRPAGAGR